MILWVVFFESRNEREFVTVFCPCEIVLVGIFIGLKPSVRKLRSHSGYDNSTYFLERCKR